MPRLLTRWVLAAAIASVGGPLWAAGMPDFGTKNFSPGADVPSFFSNENAVFAGPAPAESMDDGGDVSTGPIRAVAVARRSAGTAMHRHGLVTHARKSASGRAMHFARARNARAISIGYSTRSQRAATMTQSAGRGPKAPRAGAKPGKSGVRHAAAKSPSHRG